MDINNLNHSILCDIMNKNGSDKGNGHHNYTKLYHQLFKDLKDKPMNVLEIGIGTMNPTIPSSMCGTPWKYIPGASLRGWADYFQQSNIYGCDIDKNILFNSDRIKTFYLDQINIRESYFVDAGLKDIKFDIIIDDGLHKFSVNFEVMKCLFGRLNKGGIYIIEDIYDYDENLCNNSEFIDSLKQLGYSWQYVTIPNPLNTSDNNIFIIRPSVC